MTTEAFLDAGDARIRYTIRGTGQPLMLITGIGATIEMSLPFEYALNRFPIQTISFDPPGAGLSPPLRFPRRMPGLARIVEHLLDALGYATVDVLGVSLGGVIAQQLAHQAPERVRRLVLVATAPGVPGLGGVPGDPRAMLAMLTPRRYHDPGYFRSQAHLIYGGDPIVHGSEYERARFAHPPSWRGYLQQAWAIQGWTALPWLRTLRPPTLVLAGDDDHLIPLGNARILAQRIPNARLEIIRGGGHLFVLQRATEVAQLVAEFLGDDSVAEPVK
ncbi:MAG: alpha/beta fold hydrolase [Pseudonocardia sp.]|nr:alpha/beta fold hydrolase [Pseudonocardia sp.]